MLPSLLKSWPFEPWLAVGLLIGAGVYLRGWTQLNRASPARWPRWRAVSFCGGLAVVYLALASPLEPLAGFLLQAHMLQHMLLMMVAPPLVWLGAPDAALLRGLPRTIRSGLIAPLARASLIHALGIWLTRPMIAVLQLALITWLWHSPPAYELALRSPSWHYVQHVCFFASGLIFWRAVIGAGIGWRRPSWALVPCLLAADVQNTALAAMLTFSHRVLYPYYAEMPRLGGLSVLDDQATAGVLMWLIGSLAFLPPLVWIGVRLLSGAGERESRAIFAAATSPGLAISSAIRSTPTDRNPKRERGSARDFIAHASGQYGDQSLSLALPVLQDTPRPVRVSPQPAVNILNWPLVGRFLRWRHARMAMQLPVLLLAGVMIADGLFGPQVAAVNLAGVLPWIHWRGLLILTLLVAGNFFCAACPFMVPRSLARRWFPARRNWPRWLRSKWLAVGLVVQFLWAYEALSLWNSPWWTAWIAIGYFLTAFVVDALFKGAAFCKYVCPIGQFNFVQSLCSPLEVRAVNVDVCTTCRTKDCIRGNERSAGCELRLFVPRKVGNLDCTFCLDCVHACPHENVGLIARWPGAEIATDAPCSGIGRLSRRPDLAALVVVLVFGAFANAAGMVAPVVAVIERVTDSLGQHSMLLAVTAFYVAALLVAPTIIVGAAAMLSHRLGHISGGWLNVATRFAYTLAPLGFAMWIAHYSFHFVTSCGSISAVATRAAGDLGLIWLGQPQWACSCCAAPGDAPLRFEILMLDLGLLLSLYATYRVALSQTTSRRLALRAAAPWAIVLVLLFAAGVWIVFQPMQMRGLM